MEQEPLNKIDPSKPLTKDNYYNHQERISNGTDNLFGYLAATFHLTCELDRILKSAKNFQQLKKEITKFQEDRRTFSGFVHSNYNSKTNKFRPPGDKP